MGRVISALGMDVGVRVIGTQPMVVGVEELRFPCRNVPLATAIAFVGFGEQAKVVVATPVVVNEMNEEEVRAALEKYGRAGVVELRSGEPAEEGLARAMVQRLDFIRNELVSYREHQAARRASGMEIQLPREHLREFMRQHRILQAHLANDAVLTEDLGFGFTRPVGQPVPDPIASELASFGIDPSASTMVPGVSDIMNLEPTGPASLL